jgi:rRNA maturation endonuclease Nob1
MIDLTMEEFALWLVGVPLLGIGFAVFMAVLGRRTKIRARKREIVTCGVCGHIYKDTSKERLPECPECGRSNNRGNSRRLG